jgi:hypothetical protein
LDIKGMTEWEEIREARRKQKELEQQQREAVQQLEAEAEPDVVVSDQVEQPTDVLVTVEEILEEPADGAAVQTVDQVEDLLETATDSPPEIDEDQLLESLILEEETVAQETQEDAASGLSVDELQSFTLDDVAILDDDAEEEEPEDAMPELPLVPLLTPDAGKIRFAEDLIEDERGGRRTGRGRRGGGARGGARRGGR